MKNIKKEAKVKMKVTNIFKVIITAFLVTIFTVPLAACKEAPVVEEQVEVQQEEEKGEVTIPSETKEETQKETPPVKEEVVEKVDAPEILGLRFDPKTLTYFAEANNPYGLEKDELAGIYVPKAALINGENDTGYVARDFVGLDKKVTEYRQNETYKKTKQKMLPFWIDLSKYKNIKIGEAFITEQEDKALCINVPEEVYFCVPVSGTWYMMNVPNYPDIRVIDTSWDIGDLSRKGSIQIYFAEADILAKMKEGPEAFNPKTGDKQTLMEAELNLGETLGKTTGVSPLESFVKSGWDPFQMLVFLNSKDKDKELSGLDLIDEVGSGTNVCKVFVFDKENLK